MVTGPLKEELAEAHKKAKEVWEEKCGSSENLISDIIGPVTNFQHSFFIAPDGSKEGWPDSNAADEARDSFISYLNKSRPKFSLSWVEVMFGDDSGYSEIVNEVNREEQTKTYRGRNIKKA